MATYQKPGIQINGATVSGASFTGDAAAYEALKAHKTAKVTINGSTALVPFHAVQAYGKTVSTSEATRDDAYCAE